MQNEVLTVRWSNDDPNPVAIVKQKREFRDRFMEVRHSLAPLLHS